MKPTIHKHAMLRVPQFSMYAELADHWDSLKVAIRHSSPDFYRHIEMVAAADIPALPPAVAYTVWKYFNRARFRPVPYGTFAGIAPFDFESGSTNKLTIADEQIIHAFRNWTDKDLVNTSDPTTGGRQVYLFANSSHYLFKEHIRFISTLQEEQFQLATVEAVPAILDMLSLCRKPVSYATVAGVLISKGISKGEADLIIGALVQNQLLITSNHPNIIGEDYFKRIGNTKAVNVPYFIAERKIMAGGLNPGLFSNIPKLLSLLANVLPPNPQPELDDFILRFTRKFGDGEIPLTLALDPEYGLDYGGFASPETPDSLVSQLAGRDQPKVRTLKDLVYKEIMNKVICTGGALALEKLLPAGIPETAVLPNSFSILLTEAGGLVQLESVGGCTATALMGRFTLASDKITTFCRDMAQIEAHANPDVLFFDIGHMAEKAIDNINRRRTIYPYQLTILNYDTSANPLSMADIFVSVQGGELVLKSGRLNKRLIPRLSTAYNYARSGLPVFRLLGDLQSQGLQVNLDLNLQQLVPGLSQYPRLQYKNIVLSPAKWKITNLKQLSLLEDTRYFLAGHSDQTLCFDRQSDTDLQMFGWYLKKHPGCYVREAFIEKSSRVSDTQNLPYHTQILLNIVHGHQIYHKQAFSPLVANHKVPGIILPGMEWLYFEIYSDWNIADTLLTGSIGSLLGRHAAVIREWFFIRYPENGDHIRLRIRLKSDHYGQHIAGSLSEYLSKDLADGLVSNVLINTYKREVQRYSGNDIEEIERHFYYDSCFVLSILDAQYSTDVKYGWCASLVTEVRRLALFTELQFTGLIGRILQSYHEEHKISHADFKKINAAYKEYSKAAMPQLDHEQHKARKAFVRSFVSTLANCEAGLREALFFDLMHMHFNRLFAMHQRLHEMIFYNFLSKSNQDHLFH